jgi:hypothetical protein
LVSGEGCSLLPKWLLRFKYKMCPHKFMYWMLSPQVMVLFWKFLETLGGVALLEEVGHWRRALGAVSCPMYFLSIIKWVDSAICSRHDVLPHHGSVSTAWRRWELKPLRLWAKVNLFSFKLFLSGILPQAWRKLANTMAFVAVSRGRREHEPTFSRTFIKA